MSPNSRPLILPRPIRTAENRLLLEAWSRWRGDRLMPARADMVLTEIKPLLPLISLQEWKSRYDVRFRLVGTGIRDLLGYELTGANYVDLAPPEHREIRAARIEAMVKRPCGSLFTYQHRFPNGLVTAAETLSFPLAADRPGLPPLLLSHAAAGKPTSEHPIGAASPLAAAEDYAFVDIGAGVPDPIGL